MNAKLIKTLYFMDKIALSMLGKQYLWGGNTPIIGLDCSGFALILLKSCGIVGVNTDMTADMMDNYLLDEGAVEIVQPRKGSFIFYGRTNTDKATHVMYCLNEFQVIGATGGGSRTTSQRKAVRHEAFVKVLPWYYRSDVIRVVDVTPIIKLIDIVRKV